MRRSSLEARKTKKRKESRVLRARREGFEGKGDESTRNKIVWFPLKGEEGQISKREIQKQHRRPCLWLSVCLSRIKWGSDRGLDADPSPRRTFLWLMWPTFLSPAAAGGGRGCEQLIRFLSITRRAETSSAAPAAHAHLSPNALYNNSTLASDKRRH